MGSPLGPSLAEFYMCNLENKVLEYGDLYKTIDLLSLRRQYLRRVKALISVPYPMTGPYEVFSLK
jgi:hypothetical protein